MRSELAHVLEQIEKHDTDYEVRYVLVWRALALALQAGFAAGVRLDTAEPEWPVVHIELPTGAVTWHMPQHPVPWDGHDTAEKYRRVREFVALPNRSGPAAHWPCTHRWGECNEFADRQHACHVMQSHLTCHCPCGADKERP